MLNQGSLTALGLRKLASTQYHLYRFSEHLLVLVRLLRLVLVLWLLEE
jgi:hypothetical protein